MSKALTRDDVKLFIEKDGNYKLLSHEYVNRYTELEVFCVKCNKSFTTHYGKIRSGTWCPDCGRKRAADSKRLSHEYVKSEIERDGEYILLNEYIGYKSCLKLKCNTCGNEFKTKWNAFQQGNRCPKCAMEKCFEHNRLGIEYISTFISESGNQLLTDSYKNSQSKLKIKCGECDHEWITNWSNYRLGKRCPSCYSRNKSSKGIRKIKNILNNKSIKYSLEYRFDNCKYKHTLPFDFAIFNNDNLSCLIEYDGEQHYIPIDFSGKGEDWANNQLNMTKKRDEIKTNYCKENKIKLIRIPYWEFNNIENILEKELNL